MEPFVDFVGELTDPLFNMFIRGAVEDLIGFLKIAWMMKTTSSLFIAIST